MRDYRRFCLVNNKPAIFHYWGTDSQVVPPSALKGGHNGGIIASTYGIIEDMETGAVMKISPTSIVFIQDGLKAHTVCIDDVDHPLKGVK